jgi:hypothetical protein
MTVTLELRGVHLPGHTDVHLGGRPGVAVLGGGEVSQHQAVPAVQERRELLSHPTHELNHLEA